MKTMSAPRAQHIKTELDTHFLNVVEVAVATPEPVWWRDREEDLGPLSRLGWSHPGPNVTGTGNPIIVPYCPEIIDAQTSGLTDEELQTYLLAIEWACDVFIIRWEEDQEPEDRFADILIEMEAHVPQFWDVVSRVLSNVDQVIEAEAEITDDLDIFNEIMAGMDFDDTGINPVSDLTDNELSERMLTVVKALVGLGELTSDNPTTREARDLHSEMVALTVETNKRGLRG